MASAPKKARNETCCFGKNIKDECHQKTAVEMKSFADMAGDEQTVYRWRAGLEDNCDIHSICKYHYNKFGDDSFKKGSNCVDPFKLHTKKKKPNGTHNISLSMATGLRSMDFKIDNKFIVPGWKLCRNCHERVKEHVAGDEETTEATTEEEESTEDEMPEYGTSVLESTLHHTDQRDALNNTLEMIGISPLKTHALSKSSKVKEACEKVNKSYEKQKHMVKELFDLPDTSRLDATELSIQKDMEKKLQILIASCSF